MSDDIFEANIYRRYYFSTTLKQLYWEIKRHLSHFFIYLKFEPTYPMKGKIKLIVFLLKKNSNKI